MIERIKSKIKDLYDGNGLIHINVSVSHPRINLSNEPVKIKGVYPNIFQIEEYSTGSPKTYTLQYVDVLTKQIEIVELANNI